MIGEKGEREVRESETRMFDSEARETDFMGSVRLVK